jgi:hypothetical protein
MGAIALAGGGRDAPGHLRHPWQATGTAGRLLEGLAIPSASPLEEAANHDQGFRQIRSDRAAGNGLPSERDVPRSPWPAKGVVNDLERLYRLRRRVNPGPYPFGNPSTSAFTDWAERSSIAFSSVVSRSWMTFSMPAMPSWQGTPMNRPS